MISSRSVIGNVADDRMNYGLMFYTRNYALRTELQLELHCNCVCNIDTHRITVNCSSVVKYYVVNLNSVL